MHEAMYEDIDLAADVEIEMAVYVSVKAYVYVWWVGAIGIGMST